MSGFESHWGRAVFIHEFFLEKCFSFTIATTNTLHLFIFQEQLTHTNRLVKEILRILALLSELVIVRYDRSHQFRTLAHFRDCATLGGLSEIHYLFVGSYLHYFLNLSMFVEL